MIGTAVEKQVAAVGEGREEGADGKRLVAVALEIEVADDLGAQQADHVGSGRAAVAGRDLLGDCGAADHVAALEHKRPQPALGEVGRRGQPIVAAADDDGVVVGRHPLLRRVSRGVL